VNVRIFVKYGIFDTITRDEELGPVRQSFGKQFAQLQASGKLIEGAVFADTRGGFLLLDVESPRELNELLGSAILDHCHVETHVAMSLEELRQRFQQRAADSPSA
jgi:hypothetical protein